MTSYDSDFHDPPAPLARIVLGHGDTDAKVDDLPMLIDSGADSTILPARPIRQLGIEISDDRFVEVEDYNGNRSLLPVVEAILDIEGLRFRGSFLVDETREVGVLGRNVLNCVVIELDGPRLSWNMRKA